MKNMSNRADQWIISPLLISVLYWFIDGALYFLNGYFPSTKIWIITETVCMPALACAVLLLVNKKWSKAKRDILIVGFMATLAIWLISPFFMLFMSTFSEKGMIPLQGLGWLIVAFPMTAIMAASYSGGLYGLFATTIILPLATVILRLRQR
jgi:hypothetical protein